MLSLFSVSLTCFWKFAGARVFTRCISVLSSSKIGRDFDGIWLRSPGAISILIGIVSVILCQDRDVTAYHASEWQSRCLSLPLGREQLPTSCSQKRLMVGLTSWEGDHSSMVGLMSCEGDRTSVALLDF